VERESAARRKSFIMMFRVGAVLLRRRREATKKKGSWWAIRGVLVLWEIGEIGEIGELEMGWAAGLVDCFIPAGARRSNTFSVHTIILFKQSVTMKQERNQENTMIDAHH
jgi:hypothetical protein